jgi:predicted phage terminase large subunit-like protein
MMLDAYTTELGLASATSGQYAQAFREIFKKARRAARQKSRGGSDGDVICWGGRFLARHFGLPPSQMHRWLAGKLGSLTADRGRKINVLGPRGGAKSTLVTLAYVLRTALEGREPYIWIISDTKHQACAHLENLKAELVENELLEKSYPDAVGRGPVWRNHSITLRNGVVIEAFGTGQRLRGRRRREHRPSLIICDDLQNDNHIRSITERERSRQWFHGMLLKAGTPQTNIVNLATALHREALAMELHQTPGWTSKIFKSIVRWPRNMSLWAEWESMYTDLKNPHYEADAQTFYETNRLALDEGAAVLWPQLEDLPTLMRMRVESGHTAFEREKQNSPIDPNACEWPESYFDERIWFDDWPANLPLKTMALDPSKGADARRGDYSAFVMLAADRQGMIYVEANLARRPTPQIVADGVELLTRFQPHAFAIEANQFQDLLAVEFENEIRRRWPLGVRPIPIKNQVNKLVRIRRLGQYLSTRRLRFKTNSPGTKLLVEQLQEFPQADRDDGPDALEMALRLANELTQVRRYNDGLGNRLPLGLGS